MTLPSGTRLGTYEIAGPLGAGGMGEVYRARDSRLERDVAIKALPVAVAADSDRLARFRREAKVVAQLNHPHIAQIHQLLEHEGGTYLVLEYVPGRTLAEAIRSRAGLETEETLRLGAQIARALEAAHVRGVVHRDLKPGNVMVTPDGTAKVLDFGLAVQASGKGPDSGTRTGTPSGGVHGTPGYMAPEQIRGEDVDARADIWAFGCLLYECLAGVPAIRGRTHAELLAATLHGDPELGRLPESLPQPVRSLLRRCLTRDLGSRQQSMGEVRIALQETLGVEPVTPDTPEKTATHPNNLPRDASHFIGREVELENLAAILDQNVLLTLTGAGGSGKTRLSTELGWRLLGRFDGGVWLAELAPISDPVLVSTAVAGAFGVTEDPKQPLAVMIAHRLHGRKALLVLDNCEHLLESASDLVQALLRSVPSLRIVATSREALGVAGERSYRVPSLSLPPEISSAGRDTPKPGSKPTPSVPHRATPTGATPSGPATPATPRPVNITPLLASESVALFVDRARGVKPAFELNESNAEAVSRICRKLDGIPLAIELAAVRVKVLSPDQILSKLDDRFRLLTSGGRGVMERQRTLRAAVDWSYKLLTASERRMFRALSVFAGGWTLESAIAVCGPGGGEAGADLDEFEVLDLLTHLADKSLVQVDDGGAEPRYRFLETVRQYASEELDREGETEDTRDRHLDHYHQLMLEATGRDGMYFIPGPEWFERFERDIENLLEAMSWARTAPAASTNGLSRVGRGLRIGARLQIFWESMSLFLAVRVTLEGLLERADGEPPEWVNHAIYVLGMMSVGLGDYEVASAHLERTLEMSRAMGSKDSLRRSVNAVGTLLARKGDFEGARPYIEEGLALARDIGEPVRIAGSLQNLALTVVDDTERWRAHTREALGLYRQQKQHSGIADCLLNLGQSQGFHGDNQGARDLLEEALPHALIAGRRGRIIGTRVCLALWLGRLGDVERARIQLIEAMDIIENDANPDMEALIPLIDACMCLALHFGEPDRAVRYTMARRTLWKAMGIGSHPEELRFFDREEAAARAALREATGSDGATARAEAEGRSLTLDALLGDFAVWIRGMKTKADA